MSGSLLVLGKFFDGRYGWDGTDRTDGTGTWTERTGRGRTERTGQDRIEGQTNENDETDGTDGMGLDGLPHPKIDSKSTQHQCPV